MPLSTTLGLADAPGVVAINATVVSQSNPRPIVLDRLGPGRLLVATKLSDSSSA